MYETTVKTTGPEQTLELGRRIGAVLKGGEVLQMISDVGGGKTTFVKGIAAGMGSVETVQSPTFIISALYECANDRRLYHYDFYRLNDAGLMEEQLVESLQDDSAVTVIEWGEIVDGVVGEDSVKVRISAQGDLDRSLHFAGPDRYAYVVDALKEKS